MKKTNTIDFFSMELRQVMPLGEFWVCYFQYLERNGIWRTLDVKTFYRFDLADREITSFLVRHNVYYRVQVVQYSSPAIVAGYYALKGKPNWR